MNPPRTLRITNPGDLIAAVPALLGFHPEDSVVVLTVGSATDPFFARVDMPTCGDEVDAVAGQLAEVAGRHAPGGVAVVTYSDDAATSEAVLAALSARLDTGGPGVPIAVRADGTRWFPLGTDLPEGSGTPYDVTSHPFTLQAVVDGRVIHESRAALRDSLLPVDPDEVEAVGVAMDAALERLQATARSAVGTPGADGARSHLVAEGRWLQERVRRFVADGVRLAAEEVGRLLVSTVSVDVRDVAWSEMTREDARAHVALWRDVVRRSPLEALAAPAALLAFAAWLAGDGALAWCAVDRCQEAEPGYSMAGLVAQALAGAVPPTAWRPMPPEQLALFAG